MSLCAVLAAVGGHGDRTRPADAAPARQPAGHATAAAPTTVTLPPAAGRADYQLGGAYRLPAGVLIVSRDRTEQPAAGAYNICYVNAFQTQPQESSWWRAHHRELLLHHRSGSEVGDPDWPGEVLLDIRTPARRQALAAIVGGWFDSCARSGFAAVEPDNLDSWTRSDGLLSRSQNVAFARLLTARAHARRLAIAQKNAAELAAQGHRIGFDFAIAEECQVYGECDSYTAAYARHVVEIEYSDQDPGAFPAACRIRHGRASILYRDRALVRAGDPGYTYAAC